MSVFAQSAAVVVVVPPPARFFAPDLAEEKVLALSAAVLLAYVRSTPVAVREEGSTVVEMAVKMAGPPCAGPAALCLTDLTKTGSAVDLL